MKADGILEIPQNLEGYETGAKVNIRLLRPLREIEQGLVAIGSHDPLLDELSELLRQQAGGLSMKSSHAGSMGGLMAIRRGEAHIAGTHLLDEETGAYNVSFVETFLSGDAARLVECVNRRQGLILPKGNPKNIADIRDLSREGVRYVNRQRGSGTRILFDYLCRKEEVDLSRMYGYEREEFTHTAVAAAVAAGNADAGLGIYAAAKLYDLDFLYLCDEQYDLLIPDYAWETPCVRKLLELLKSDAFADRLDRLGGYTTDRPGEVRRRFGKL